MAGEQIETDDEVKPNGVGKLSHEDKWAADRAAFLAGDPIEEDDAGGKKPNKRDAIEDDDSDLDDVEDEDDRDESADGDDEGDEDEEDEDSDLDEDDEDQGDDEDEDDKPDADTSKRLDQVRRTDKRLREQRDRDFAARERALDEKVAQLEAEWKPRFEALEKFEKATSRINVDVVGVLQALGLKPERYEHTAQLLYTLAKGKDDPKSQAAAAHLVRERERDDEIERLKKRDEERETREREREQQAAADRELEAYFGKVTKAATEKTPLARAYLKSDPREARERMQVIAFRIAKQEGTGRLPSERAVIIAFEKERRAELRKMGLDPKKLTASEAAAALDTKTTPKTGDKKTAKSKKSDKGKREDKRDDEDKPLTKAEFVRRARDGQFD